MKKMAMVVLAGVATIVPHNAFADSLMDDISAFVEANTVDRIFIELT